jgi:hypothetical protein
MGMIERFTREGPSGDFAGKPTLIRLNIIPTGVISLIGGGV